MLVEIQIEIIEAKGSAKVLRVKQDSAVRPCIIRLN